MINLYIKKLKKMNINKNKRIIGIILIIFFLAPQLFFLKTQKVEAQLYTVYDPANFVKNTISSTQQIISTSLDKSIWTKEFILDQIALKIARMAIQEMIASSINWINSGFDGNPAFITDLDGYLENVGDRVLSEYLYGTKLDFLCSPFKLQIKNALAANYIRARQDYQPKCTLSAITDNIDGVIDDLDREWDWGVWNSITQTSTNNVFGQYIDLMNVVGADIDNETKNTITELNWGQGFISWKNCPEDGVGPCEIMTPGKLFADELTNDIEIRGQVLVQADEFGEIVDALLTQLFKKVSGSGGLRGVSSSSNRQPSYTSRMISEESIPSANTISRTVNTINTDIETETSYRNTKQNSLDAVDNTQNRLSVLQDCITSTDGFISTISITATIENTLNPLRDRLTSEIKVSQNNIDTLTPIRDAVYSAQTTNKLSKIIEDYQSIIISGILHNTADVINAENEGIINQMNNLITSIDLQITQCRNFGQEEEGGNY